MARNKQILPPGYSDIDDPGTWKRFRKGLCDNCSAGCCTLILEVTARDLIRLEITDEWEVENCLKDLIKRLKKEGIIKRYNFKTGTFVMEQKKNGDCLFLNDDRKCISYDNRPDVCRAHPTKLSSRKGFCPYSPM